MHAHHTAFRLAGRTKISSPRQSKMNPLIHGAALASLGMMLGAFPSAVQAQAPNLGTAANFAVLAGSTVTNTGPTVLLGSLGVSPGNAVTGFPPGIVTAPGGVFIGDAVAIQAQIDLAIGYNAVAARPPTADLTGQDLGGLTLTPGVYNFASAAQLTGSLTGTRSQRTSSNKPGSEQKPPTPHTPESNRRDAYNVAGLTDMSSFASSTNGTQIDRDEDRAVQAPAEKSSEHILAPTNVHEQVETKQ